MSKGLVKAKKYDWRGTNLALFGLDTENQVMKESAESEPAWQGVGQEQFKVTEWPQEDYGKFYSGDSYIILNTYKPKQDNKELTYNVHFWIGSSSSSTQDEYSTVAYKTIELDAYLDDKAVQHREVQGHESETFRSYFKQIIIMEGGADSGSRHVAPEDYMPRLMHFSGKGRHVTVKEIPLSRSRLTAYDVFILDLGTTLYQWNGAESSKDERFKAMQFMQELKSERGDVQYEVLEGAVTPLNHKFYDSLIDEDEDEEDLDSESICKLYRVSEVSGSIEISKIKDAEVTISDFTSDDVHLLDCGDVSYVWIGQGASWNKKKNGFAYAHVCTQPFPPIDVIQGFQGSTFTFYAPQPKKHLMHQTHALVPIVVIKEGQYNPEFKKALAASM